MVFVSSTSPHWSPISCCSLFPCQVGLGPARSQVGLGFALVDWFRRFRPFFPPAAGLGPCPSASAFLFPCPFNVCQLRARGVGVCFLFSFLRSPLSSHLHRHLTFIVSHFHLHLIGTSSCPASAGCVCGGERLHRRKTSAVLGNI